MNRRTFVTLGAGIAGAAVAGVRLGFPRYRVRLNGRDGTFLGEWEVPAIERYPQLYEVVANTPPRPNERHLWIDPINGSGWDGVRKENHPGEGGYHDGPFAESPACHHHATRLKPLIVWGKVPWGDVRQLCPKHNGLWVAFERIA